MKVAITFSELQDRLHYCPESGIFTWIKTRGPYVAGSIAGYKASDRRIKINTKGRIYRAHRLAWLYMTGGWPMHEIDHIDGDPANNKWANLRDVTPTVNKQNQRKIFSNKKYSQILGAYWCAKGGFWKSSIRVNGKSIHLGVFRSDVEAGAAYLAAKRRLHEGCTI